MSNELDLEVVKIVHFYLGLILISDRITNNEESKNRKLK